MFMTRFPRAVEKAIFERAKGICQICGRETDFGDGEIEHILSVSKGGSDEIENLQWACHRCNKLKGKNLSNEQVRKTLGLPANFEEIMKLRSKSLTPRANRNIKQAQLKHSKYILLTRSDCQGLEDWSEGTLIENLLKHSKDKLETVCVMQHFKTGYQDELWTPLMEYKKLMQKYEYPIVPFPTKFREYSFGYEQSLIEPFERIPEDDRKQMQELKTHLLNIINKIIFGVKNGIPLNGECEFCPNIAYAYSTLSRPKIENKKKRIADLKNEFEKVYGPIYTVLNNVLCVEVKTGILTQNEKKLMDETFSKEPFILDSQIEWKNKIRNRPIRRPPKIDIPMKFIEYFKNEYERKRGKEAVEKRFSKIYSMFKNVPQEVEEVGILLPHEKALIDEKFSTYPFMFNQELYDYWNREIRSLKMIIGYEAFEHKLTLLENLKLNEKDLIQMTIGVYRVPKAFIMKFLEEYNDKLVSTKQHDRSFA
jgi:5-methylcytosine-specific restriction protein A